MPFLENPIIGFFVKGDDSWDCLLQTQFTG